MWLFVASFSGGLRGSAVTKNSIARALLQQSLLWAAEGAGCLAAAGRSEPPEIDRHVVRRRLLQSETLMY